MANVGAQSHRTGKLLAALASNWQAEMEGYHTYLALAERDTDPIRAQVLRHLAQAELEHAALWGNRLRELGGSEPIYKGHPKGEANSLANRSGSQETTLRRLEIEESRHIATYGKQLQELGDTPSIAIFQRVIEDEKEHYRELSALLRGHSAGTQSASGHRIDPQTILDEMLARREEAHPQTGSSFGSWIGDAIYGINDGLGAIFGIVSGVSGATAGNSRYVLLAGISGMIASALSMGSGAWLAARSEREIYAAELTRERDALAVNPSEARELLSLYYQVKGLPQEDADRVVDHLAQDSEHMVRILTAERLHSTEEGLRTPWISALSGSLSTAVGAFIPIVPFFFLHGIEAVIAAGIVSLAAHFAVGAAKSLITVRSWWASGLEMTAVGAIEGAVTYGIGIFLGNIGI